MAARTEKTASTDRRADGAIALPPPGRRARLSALPVAERREAARRLVDAAVADLLARGEPVTALSVQRRAGLSQTPLRDPAIKAAIADAEARSVDQVVAAVQLPAPGERRDLRHLPPSHRRAVTLRLIELAIAELRRAGEPTYREAVQRRTGLSDTALRADGARAALAAAATPRSDRHAAVCEERRARVARALEAVKDEPDEPTQSDVARRAGVSEKFVLQDAECQALCADAGVRKRRHPVPLRERLTGAILQLGAHRPWPLSPGDVCQVAEAPASSLDAHPDLRRLVDDTPALQRFLSEHGVEVDLPDRRRLALAEEQQAVAVLRELHGRGEVPSRSAVAARTGFGEGRLRHFPRFERLRGELLGEGDAAVDLDVRRLGLDRVEGLDSVGSRRDYARRVKRYEDWAERTGRAAHPITRATALDYLAARQDAGVQETTLGADRQALNAVARAQGYAVPLPSKHGPRHNRLAEAVTRAYRAASEYALDPSRPKPGVEARREDTIDDRANLAVYRQQRLIGRDPGRALVFQGADGETVRALLAFEPEAALAWLGEKLQRIQRRAGTRATHEVYVRRMSFFLAFCDLFERSPLPARVDTVTKFLVWLAAGHFDGKPRGMSVLRQCAATIAYAHRKHGIPSPTSDPAVGEALDALERHFGKPPVQSAPVSLEDLRVLVETMDDSGTVRAVRDKAWVLLTFGGAARVSQTTTRRGMDFDDEDVVTLTWGNVRIHGARQIEFRIQRAKHRAPGEVPPKYVDQSSFNRTDWTSPTCPVRALLDWKAEMARRLGWQANDARLHELPVFPRLRPVGPRHLGNVRVLVEPISKAQMAASFKAWALLADLPEADRMSSHSLKIGHVAAALDGGADLDSVADQADHRRIDSTKMYARGRDRRRHNSSQCLGY